MTSPIITPSKSVKPTSKNDDIDDMANGTPWDPNDDDLAPVNARQSQDENIAEHKAPPETLFTSNDANKPPPEESITKSYDANKSTPEIINKATDANDNKTLAQYDDQGIVFAPSCTVNCFTSESEWEHTEIIKVSLKKVGDYVKFPSLLWHKGYSKIVSGESIFFTAQFFCTP